MKTAFLWDPSLAEYRFRPDHPFNPKRLELTVSLLQEAGLLDDPDRVVRRCPRAATDEELALVHDPGFVRTIRSLSRGEAEGEAWRCGLGTEDTPVFPGMHEVTARVVGGTLAGAEMVMSGEVTRAFNIAGGLHHGHRAMASGFCIYNDLAVAIAWIRARYDARVLYFDYDAHHGDGVQGLFYDDPDVLTLSIHESGRYLFPGTGFVDELGEGAGHGYSLNLPLDPFTEDDSWMEVTGILLPEVVEAFRPDVLVVQNGCDGHALDPLTHLRATTRVYRETARLVSDLADRFCEGRIVATGGGGYAIWQVVPRAWTLLWAGLSGQEAPARVPTAWIERWQGESPYLLPAGTDDPAGCFPAVPRRSEIEAANRRTLESLRRAALPLLRGWGMGF